MLIQTISKILLITKWESITYNYSDIYILYCVIINCAKLIIVLNKHMRHICDSFQARFVMHNCKWQKLKYIFDWEGSGVDDLNIHLVKHFERLAVLFIESITVAINHKSHK